jgi:mRNA-degrading endonuclease RelE of RelBE toxin-antitoxin system
LNKTNQYTLSIPEAVERQLRGCRAAIRASIRKRLDEIADHAGARPGPDKRAPAPQGPPARFYVFEGYRVFYRVEPATRRVVVLELHSEIG